eukprot:338051_1
MLAARLNFSARESNTLVLDPIVVNWEYFIFLILNVGIIVGSLMGFFLSLSANISAHLLRGCVIGLVCDFTFHRFLFGVVISGMKLCNESVNIMVRLYFGFIFKKLMETMVFIIIFDI